MEMQGGSLKLACFCCSQGGAADAQDSIKWFETIYPFFSRSHSVMWLLDLLNSSAQSPPKELVLPKHYFLLGKKKYILYYLGLPLLKLHKISLIPLPL